jgi:prepilin-type N-terminal cleavage/methylation domain-containing protein
MKINSQKAFTLIELLVVVAIIGLLVSVIAVGFGNVRLRSRDSKRLSDMQQVKVGLDLYYSTASGYPDEAIWDSGYVTCNGQQFMQIPKDPQTGLAYEYFTDNPAAGGTCGATWKNYYVRFVTEGHTDLGDEGEYFFTPRGFSSTAPF